MSIPKYSNLKCTKTTKRNKKMTKFEKNNKNKKSTQKYIKKEERKKAMCYYEMRLGRLSLKSKK